MVIIEPIIIGFAVCICDECQHIFIIKLDNKGNYYYNGSECNCESPYTVIYRKERKN